MKRTAIGDLLSDNHSIVCPAMIPYRLGFNPMDDKPWATKLNLGCGKKPIADAVNVDITPTTDPDVVHNLNMRPWPFPADRFDEVVMFDVLEHLDDLVGVMEEIHRVARAGAVVRITTPHYSCANAFTDPTHRHQLGWYSLDYFTGDHEHSYYTKARFRMRSRQLVFHPTLLNKLVWRLANRWPAGYERGWAWLFPAWFLAFELEVLKQGKAQ